MAEIWEIEDNCDDVTTIIASERHQEVEITHSVGDDKTTMVYGLAALDTLIAAFTEARKAIS